jgi:hypothetical protein
MMRYLIVCTYLFNSLVFIANVDFILETDA